MSDWAFTEKWRTCPLVLSKLSSEDKMFHSAFCPLAHRYLPWVVLQGLGTKRIREEMCIS